MGEDVEVDEEAGRDSAALVGSSWVASFDELNHQEMLQMDATIDKMHSTFLAKLNEKTVVASSSMAPLYFHHIISYFLFDLAFVYKKSEEAVGPNDKFENAKKLSTLNAYDIFENATNRYTQKSETIWLESLAAIFKLICQHAHVTN